MSKSVTYIQEIIFLKIRLLCVNLTSYTPGVQTMDTDIFRNNTVLTERYFTDRVRTPRETADTTSSSLQMRSTCSVWWTHKWTRTGEGKGKSAPVLN